MRSVAGANLTAWHGRCDYLVSCRGKLLLRLELGATWFGENGSLLEPSRPAIHLNTEFD